MPTYEYACSSCGNAWEEIQKMSEPALDECPKCHEKTAKRLISQGNFILKGGGWYTTGGYGSPAKSVDSADAKATASSDAATGSTGTASASSASSASSAPSAPSATGTSGAASTPSAPAPKASEPAKSDASSKPTSS